MDNEFRTSALCKKFSAVCQKHGFFHVWSCEPGPAQIASIEGLKEKLIPLDL